ncbi:Protein fantom, partial [Armadillidium nasatum]
KHQESHSETESSSSSSSTSSISKSSSSNKSSSSSSSSKSSSMMKEMEYGTLKIEIVGLILEENTQIMRAPSIQYLIVDYFGFLDLEPEYVETPKSLPKPKAGVKSYFNFMNQIKLTRKQRQMLDKLEKQDAEIKFHLSAEPSAESKDDEDIELARASLKIRSMIKGFKGGIPLQELEKGIKIGTLFILTSFENRVKNN